MTIGDKIYSANYGGELTVVSQTAGGFLASADGLAWSARSWHKGPGSGEETYVERLNAAGQAVFHGYVDKESRLLVQAG